MLAQSVGRSVPSLPASSGRSPSCSAARARACVATALAVIETSRMITSRTATANSSVCSSMPRPRKPTPSVSISERRVHPREDVRHAMDADRADDDEEAAGEQRRPGEDVEHERSSLALEVLGRAVVVAERAVAEELQHRQRADHVQERIGDA